MAQNLKPRSQPLEIVERIARNLPIRDLSQHYLDTKSGRLYAAIGIDEAGRYQGVWAFTRHPPIARVLHFAADQSRALCVNKLFEDAAEMLVAMETQGLMTPEAHFSG